MEGYIGEIRLFGGNFAPVNWFFCHGQVLSIAQYSALFSIIGTTYGGNGTNTFALPDLRGRVPLGSGTGPGLSPRTTGGVGGAEVVTLTAAQLPNHTHALRGSGEKADDPTPGGNVLARGEVDVYRSTTGVADMDPASIGGAGGGLPHENMPPFMGMNYIICASGLYPSRS
jgi:microcystin-dependent protein